MIYWKINYVNIHIVILIWHMWYHILWKALGKALSDFKVKMLIYPFVELFHNYNSLISNIEIPSCKFLSLYGIKLPPATFLWKPWHWALIIWPDFRYACCCHSHTCWRDKDKITGSSQVRTDLLQWSDRLCPQDL